MSEQEKRPWTARQFQADSYTYNWCVEDRDGKDVVLACTKDTAFVLSASLELLEACELIEQWWLEEGMIHFHGAPAAIFKTRDAIRKARGES